MSAEQRFLAAARRGRPAHELDLLLSYVYVDNAVPRLRAELQRVSKALAYCPDVEAHIASDLIRAAIAVLENLDPPHVASSRCEHPPTGVAA